MKAVVLEKVNNEFIVLAKDESMHSIPCAAGIDVGDVIDLNAYQRRQWVTRSNMQKLMAAAAALMIAFFGVFSYMTFDVSATVTTDGDASIVYYLNHRGQVLRAEALNEAGEEVLEEMGGVSNRPSIEDILNETEAAMHRKGYLADDEHLTYETDTDNDGIADEKTTLKPVSPSGTDSGVQKDNAGNQNSKDQSEQTNQSSGSKSQDQQEPAGSDDTGKDKPAGGDNGGSSGSDQPGGGSADPGNSGRSDQPGGGESPDPGNNGGNADPGGSGAGDNGGANGGSGNGENSANGGSGQDQPGGSGTSSGNGGSGNDTAGGAGGGNASSAHAVLIAASENEEPLVDDKCESSDTQAKTM